MKHTIRMIAQLIQATTEANSAMYEVAGKIADLAGEANDSKEAIEAIGKFAHNMTVEDREKTERTPESDARAYAWNLCHAMIGLIHADNGVKLPELAPWAMEAISETLEEKVQLVQSNSSSIKRFYTEDCSERQWNAKHHLLDLTTDGGKNYMMLRIHQFAASCEDCNTIDLACNEVEELLAVLLTARMEEAKQNHKRYTPQQQAKGDDFDPFLDGDDLP